jgi:hypothetical protein
MNLAYRVRELIRDHQVLAALKDLKRLRQVRRARHAGHEALALGVELEAIRVVALLLLERGRQIRNLATFYDAGIRRLGMKRAEHVERRRPRFVRPDVPVRGHERLPDAVQVGPAVAGTRDPGSACIVRNRRRSRRAGRQRDQCCKRRSPPHRAIAGFT